MNRVLITGSSKGIGAKIAEILAKDGYHVFLHGRDENALKNLAQKIGARGFFAIDLTSENAAQNLYDNAIDTLGSIDILVNVTDNLIKHINPVLHLKPFHLLVIQNGLLEQFNL